MPETDLPDADAAMMTAWQKLAELTDGHQEPIRLVALFEALLAAIEAVRKERV